MKRIQVGILGATGTVGQGFVRLLAGHPWFEVAAVAASERSAGKSFGEACRWRLSAPLPDRVGRLPVLPLDPRGMAGIPLVFSALPADVACDVEPSFVAEGFAVSSNASSYRQQSDVPLVIPEVNPDHLRLIDLQRRVPGKGGFLVTNPNCTTTGIALALKPLHDAFELSSVVATSMQAVSGAGYPGVASLDILDNVVPWIFGEEEKIETETRLLLGHIDGRGKVKAEFEVSAHANRVSVLDGHTVCLSLGFQRPCAPRDAIDVLHMFRGASVDLDLPSAPERPVLVREEGDRPQPRLDRDAGRGMTVTVGRVRTCSVLDLKLVLVVHNTVRGAAGGSIENGELLVRGGWLS
ncbi:MAG: aspartate-semialdehyde dehydrogenase [Thermotogota bacterium]